MKKLLAYYSIMIPVILLLLITGCKKEPKTNLPLLSTVAVSSIDSTTAVSGGNIFSEGGDSVIARGVCWSIGALPIVSNNATTDGKGTGSFISSIKGLTKGTLYYVRAYATNSFGTAYGQVMVFSTLGASPYITPTVITLDASNISTSTATLNGTVDNSSAIADVYFEYGTTNAYGTTIPATLNNTIPAMAGAYDPNSMILVTADISGLMSYTTYHFRVVISNSHGITYGDDFLFTTTY